MSMRGIILLGLTMSCAPGCQETPPPAFQVNGRLIVGFAPAAKACIAFHPLDKVKSQGRCPVALTRADGSFELTTYTMNDGAPVGDYTVTVTWPDESIPEDECECVDPAQHDRLHGEYADPERTPLLVTVLPQTNEVILWTPAAGRNSWPGSAR